MHWQMSAFLCPYAPSSTNLSAHPCGHTQTHTHTPNKINNTHSHKLKHLLSCSKYTEWSPSLLKRSFVFRSNVSESKHIFEIRKSLQMNQYHAIEHVITPLQNTVQKTVRTSWYWFRQFRTIPTEATDHELLVHYSFQYTRIRPTPFRRLQFNESISFHIHRT